MHSSLNVGVGGWNGWKVCIFFIVTYSRSESILSSLLAAVKIPLMKGTQKMTNTSLKLFSRLQDSSHICYFNHQKPLITSPCKYPFLKYIWCAQLSTYCDYNLLGRHICHIHCGINAMYSYMGQGSTPCFTDEKLWFRRTCGMHAHRGGGENRTLNIRIPWPKCSHTLGWARAIVKSTRASSGHREHSVMAQSSSKPVCEHILPFRFHPLSVVLSHSTIMIHYAINYSKTKDKNCALKCAGQPRKISKSVNIWSSFGRNWIHRAAMKALSAEQQGIGAMARTWKC